MTTRRTVRIHRFAGLSVAGIHHGIAERSGGVSPAPFASLNLSVKTGDKEANVDENRRRFLAALGAQESRPVYGRLTHGRDVAVCSVLDSGSTVGGVCQSLNHERSSYPTKDAFPADAALSNVPGLTLVMTFADCVPVFLWDGELNVCGLVHGGWRGTALRAASTAVATMCEAFGSRPAAIAAGIGPCVGQCCYSVGTDVEVAFQKAYGNRAGVIEGGRLDLRKANLMDLVSAGLSPSNVEVLDTCTSCRSDLFFSHRAERGSTGRFGGGIGLDGPGPQEGWAIRVHHNGVDFTPAATSNEQAD